MKSKITIDVDWDNQPIIKIEHEDSPDVRDKLVKRFLETFRGDSCWANFSHDMYSAVNTTAKVRPIHPNQLDEQVEMFIKAAKENKITENPSGSISNETV